MDELDYLRQQIKALIGMAQRIGDGLLVYLLEMALEEAEAELRRRKD